MQSVCSLVVFGSLADKNKKQMSDQTSASYIYKGERLFSD